MGPYCKYCNTRCFVALTESLWNVMTEEQREKYRQHPRRIDIIATCPHGQAFEKERIDVCRIGDDEEE